MREHGLWVRLIYYISRISLKVNFVLEISMFPPAVDLQLCKL